MHEAFELGGEDHVDDRKREEQHEEDFLAGFAQVASFAGPIMKETGRQIVGEESFDAIDGGSHRDFGWDSREGRGDGGAAQAVVMLDAVWSGAAFVGDDGAELNEIAATIANVK